MIASIPIGISSGLLNGSVSMSGPPVILFLSNLRLKKNPFRSSLVFYFFLLNIITIVIFSVMGIVTGEVLIFSGLILPPAILGMCLGSPASKRIEERIFRRIELVLVSLAGSMSLIGGIMGLF